MKTPSHIAVLALAVSLAACARHESPQTLMNDALALQSQGNYSGAIIQLKNVLRQEPKNAVARFRLGSLYLDTLKYAAAADELERARDLGYKKSVIDPLLARAWLRSGKYERVLEDPLPDKSAADYPALAAAHADADLAAGKLIAAQETLSDALAAFPNNPDLHLARARILLQSSHPKQALAEVNEALAQDPKMVDALLLKGDLLRAERQLGPAQQAYQAILAINPHHDEARLALARMALAQGKSARARQLVAEVLKDTPNSLQAHYTEALVDYQTGKIAKAHSELVPVLRSAPDYVPVLLLSGVLEFSLDHLQEAETLLGKVVAADHANLFARRLLAETQLRLGELDDAQATLALLDPQSSQDAAVLTLAGRIALAQDRPADAAAYFQRASAIAPKNPVILTDLAVSRLGTGDEAGLQDLQNAAKLDKANPQPEFLLALTYLQRQQYDKALRVIAVLEKKQPRNPATWNLQGGAYVGMKNLAAARQSFQKALAYDPKYYPAAANLANLDLMQHQPQAANQEFQTLLKADPKNLSAMLALARLALAQKDDKAYLGWVDKAAAAHPNAVQPRLLKAAYYLSRGDTAQALVHAREAHDLQPSDAAALELLGQAQLAAGEKANGLNSFQKLAGLQPKSAESQLWLAHAYELNGDQNKTLKHLQQAAQLSGNAAAVQIALCQQYIKMQRYDDAVAVTHALSQNPTDRAVALSLNGDIAFARKNYPAAITAYQKALKLKPASLIVLRLYNAQAAAGDHAQAIDTLQTWVKSHPNDLEVANALGQAYLVAGRYPAAAQLYQQLVVREPNDVALLNNLSWALTETRSPQAIQFAQRAYRLAPDNPSVLDTYGWALVQGQQSAKGLVFLRQAESKQPDSAEVQWHVAYALYASGERARALVELKDLLNNGAGFADQPKARALYQQLSSASP